MKYLGMLHIYGPVPLRRVPILKKERKKRESIFLVLCLLLHWHTSKDHLEPVELAMIKGATHTHTNKNRITQQSCKTKDLLKWIAYSKGAASWKGRGCAS